MDLFKNFATDPAKEAEGVWEEYDETASFLIARQNNKAYDRMMAARVKPHERLLKQTSEASEKKSDEIIIEVMAKTILLGWRGTFEWDGKPVGEYSVEKAKQMLAVKDFRQWVSEVSRDVNRFKVEAEEEEAKN